MNVATQIRADSDTFEPDPLLLFKGVPHLTVREFLRHRQPGYPGAE